MKNCILCGMPENGKLGEMLTQDSINVHLVCLFFTPNLVQKEFTSPKDTLRGFSPDDIVKEAERVANNESCYLCTLKQANLGCCAAKCRKIFHALCGLLNGAHLDSQNFNSYCYKCARKMNSAKRTKHKTDAKCLLCQQPMGKFGRLTSVPATCCQAGYFHRDCIGKVANEEGIHFKCPMCGDAKDENLFIEVKRRCVFLPDETHEDAKHRPNEICMYCKSFMGFDEKSAFGPCCRHWFHQKCLDFDKCPLCNKLIPGLYTAKGTKQETPQESNENSDDSVSTHSGVDEDSLTDAMTEIFELPTEFEVKHENLTFNDSPRVTIHGTSSESTKRKSNTESPPSNKRMANSHSPMLNGAFSDLSNNLLVNRGCTRTVSLMNKMRMLTKRLDGMAQRLNEFQTDMRQMANDFATLCEEYITVEAAPEI